MIISWKKSLLILIPYFLLILGFIFYSLRFQIEFAEINTNVQPSRVKARLPLEEKINSEQKESNESVSAEKEEITQSVSQENQASEEGDSLPQEFSLEVPFAPQSPYAVWDERDEESCEEASLVIVHYYWQKKGLSKELMRQELDALIDFQIKSYGEWKDSDVAGIARLARDYYGYQKVKVYYDPTIEEIKVEIVQGNPVIIPAAGRLLENPYFTPPGPLYHNLVLIGFNQEGFITNDPGTRRGENYFYPYDIVYNAIHDFPGSKEAIEQGRKAMIIVK